MVSVNVGVELAQVSHAAGEIRGTAEIVADDALCRFAPARHAAGPVGQDDDLAIAVGYMMNPFLIRTRGDYTDGEADRRHKVSAVRPVSMERPARIHLFVGCAGREPGAEPQG